MTNKQIANYEFNARITNPDEPSDHELLLMLVKDMKDVKTRLSKVENKLDNVIKLNNLRTE